MKIFNVKNTVFLSLFFVLITAIPKILSASGQEIYENEFKAIDSLIVQQISNDELVGAELLITKNNDVLFHKAYGWKDREEGEKLKLNTVFNIRSMTKLFTAAVVHQLISEGKLDCTDKVNNYLNGFDSPSASEITIKQLLTHTSGLPISIIQDFDDYENQTDLAQQIGESDQIMNSGKFRYSDAGYDVLGAIIETICAQPLELVFKQRIFDKLNMDQTFPIIKTANLALDNVASLYGGYTGKWLKFWSPKDKPYYNFAMGSQSFYSTPTDYSKFMSLFLNEGKFGSQQILTLQAATDIIKPQNEYKLPVNDIPYQNGFGGYITFMGETALVFTSNNKRVKIIGSGGSDGTFSWVFMDEGIVVSFFTQSRKKEAFPMKPMEEALYSIFFEQNEKQAEKISVYQPHKRYLGNYTTDVKPFDKGIFKISSKDSTLSVFIPGQMDFELNNPMNGEWSFKVSPLVSISFKEKDDLIEGFYLNQKVEFEKSLDSLLNEDVTSDDPSIYTGEYKFPQYNMTSTVSFENEVFFLELIPGQKSVIEMSADKSYWLYKNDKAKRIEFERDEKGIIKTMFVTSSIFVAKD